MEEQTYKYTDGDNDGLKDLQISLLNGTDKKIKFGFNNKPFQMKLFLFTSFIFLITIRNNINIANITVYNGVNWCSDLLFNLTEGINSYLSLHEFFNNFLTIVSSILTDFLILFTMCLWVFKWTDWTLVTSIVLFYSFRFLILFIFQMPYPIGYIFQYPGFPSLTVSYLTTNDFFYSGHAGFPTLCYKEFERRGYKFKYFCVFVIIFQFIFMILVRGHYTIDLIFGILYALYFYYIASNFAVFILRGYKLINDKLIN